MTGSLLYLAVVAGLVFTLVAIFWPYLVARPTVPIAIAPPTAPSGNPSILSTWQGAEQAAFANVLKDFQQRSGVSVSYTSAGQELPRVLGMELTQGRPPDVAILPQPGELADLAEHGKLVPLDGIVDQRRLDDMNPRWQDYATWRGKLYGVYFKASNKSVIWYRPDLFRKAGIARTPATWGELVDDATMLREAGIKPFAMCGASAWTLTDWFENLYLQMFGGESYRSLAAHAGTRWTDPSVRQALDRMADVFRDDNMINGRTGAVSTPYPECVNQVFGGDPVLGGDQAAMVYEGDFVQTQIRSLGFTHPGPKGDYDWFRFPAVSPGSGHAVVVGGDVAVMLRDTPQARELIKYLATTEAGRSWGRQGGFISPHRGVRGDDYTDRVSSQLAAALTDPGTTIAFDMSDQAPAAFGATVNGGEWAALQAWLSNPAEVTWAQEQLEKDAEKYYRA